MSQIEARRRRCASALRGGATKRWLIIELPFGRANFAHLLYVARRSSSLWLHFAPRAANLVKIRAAKLMRYVR